MHKKDQKLVRHKTAQQRRRYRNQKPPYLELSEEKVTLDKNAWGDNTTNRLERVISNSGIQEQEHGAIKEKSIKQHCINKNDEGLLHRVKMFFKREKSVEENQKLTRNNEDMGQQDKNKYKHPSKNNDNSKKSKPKTKCPDELEPNRKRQEVMEQKPSKSDVICLKVEDLYCRKKPEKNPQEKLKSNVQTVDKPPQQHTENGKNHVAKEARKNKKHQIKDLAEGINSVGPYEKYLPFIRPTDSEQNAKINKQRKKEELILREETESIRKKLEEKIKHELQEDLKAFSCHLENIFNEKFDLFLQGYERQREKRKREKKEQTKTSNRKNEDCKNPKEEIIKEVLQRLINENYLPEMRGEIFSNRLTEERKPQKLSLLKHSSCQATSETNPRVRVSEINSGALIEPLALHVTKKENRLSKDNKPQKKYDKFLSSVCDVGVIEKHKEKRSSFATENANSSQKNEEITISRPEKCKKPQRQLNCETVPLVNIISNASQIQNHKRNSSCPARRPKPRCKDDVLPPDKIRKPKRQLSCYTVPIINIFPEAPNAIQSESYKERRQSSSGGKKTVVQSVSKPKYNEKLVISPPESLKDPQRQMNFDTVAIVNILPELIPTEKRKSRKRNKDNKDIVILLPVQFKNSQEFHSNTLSMISILPETINAIKAKNPTAKRESSTSEWKSIVPRHDSEEIISILPPMNFRNPSPKKFKHCKLSVIAIFPKSLKTIQTQTGNKGSLEKNLLEKRKTSKRFRSYYQYQLTNDSRERTNDFSSIVSDSYRNVLGSSEEQVQPELEEIFFRPRSFSSSNDSDHLNSTGEESLQSDESTLIARTSHCQILTSTSSDDKKVSNFYKRDVKCRPNKSIPETNSRNYVATSKYKNKVAEDKTNKQTFVDNENSVKVFKHCGTKPEKSHLEEQTNSMKIPAVSTIEASVGSAVLNKDDSIENIENHVIYEFIDILEEKVTETVDAAIGSEMPDVYEEKEYREMSVGTRQIYESKPPHPSKSTPTHVPPLGFRRNVVVNVGTGDVASTNKSKIPVQKFKPAAISPDRFVRNAPVQPYAEILKIKQITKNSRTSSAGISKARPKAIPKKETCYSPVRPQTSRAKPPVSLSRPKSLAPIRESPNIISVETSNQMEFKASQPVKSQTPRAKSPSSVLSPRRAAPIHESPIIFNVETSNEMSEAQVEFEATEPVKPQTPTAKPPSSVSSPRSPAPLHKSAVIINIETSNEMSGAQVEFKATAPIKPQTPRAKPPDPAMPRPKTPAPIQKSPIIINVETPIKIKPQTPSAKTAASISRPKCPAPIHESPIMINVETSNKMREALLELPHATSPIKIKPQTPRAKAAASMSRPKSPAPIHESPIIETSHEIPVKPQTPRAKRPSSVSTPSSPLQKSPRKNVEARVEIKGTKKSKTNICLEENAKIKGMQRFKYIPQTSWKYRAVSRFDTKNGPANDDEEVSTYEKRKRYDRALRKMMKYSSKNKNPTNNNRELVKTHQENFEDFGYQTPPKNNKIRTVLDKAVECVESCLDQMGSVGTVSSNISKKLFDALENLPVMVIDDILKDNDNLCVDKLTRKSSVECLYSSSKYRSSSSKEICSSDDDDYNSLENLRLQPNVSSFSCPSLIEYSPTFEYLYEAPTPIASSSSDFN